MNSSKMSRFFNESPAERAARRGPEPRGSFDRDDMPEPVYSSFPFTSHRTLAEVWRYRLYQINWKKQHARV